jgi:hypothetical protein
MVFDTCGVGSGNHLSKLSAALLFWNYGGKDDRTSSSAYVLRYPISLYKSYCFLFDHSQM